MGQSHDVELLWIPFWYYSEGTWGPGQVSGNPCGSRAAQTIFDTFDPILGATMGPKASPKVSKNP